MHRHINKIKLFSLYYVKCFSYNCQGRPLMYNIFKLNNLDHILYMHRHTVYNF